MRVGGAVALGVLVLAADTAKGSADCSRGDPALVVSSMAGPLRS
jgi:hypothetical protein